MGLLLHLISLIPFYYFVTQNNISCINILTENLHNFFVIFLRVYDSKTYELKLSKETCHHYRLCGVIHPNGKHVIVVSGQMKVAVFTLSDLEMVCEEQVLDNDDGSLTCLALNKDAAKLLIGECRNHNSELSVAKVYDVSDDMTFKENLVIKDYKARIFACDISSDGELGCIAGHNGTRVFNLNTGETQYSFDRGGFFVKFDSTSRRLLYSEYDGFFIYDPAAKQDVCSYIGIKGIGASNAVFLQNEKYIMATFNDGTLRIFDTEDEGKIYGFFNHRAQEYTSLAVHPSEKMFLAANKNSMIYILTVEMKTVE